MTERSGIGMLLAIAAVTACGSRSVTAPDSGTSHDGSGDEEGGAADGGDGGGEGQPDAGDPIDASTDIHCWHDLEACPPDARYCCEPHDTGSPDEGLCYRTPPLIPVDYYHCEENPPEGTTIEIDCNGENNWPDPDLCPAEFPYCCGYRCADHPIVGANCRG